MGKMGLRRQTQHKAKTNPEQIGNEDEDPIEQMKIQQRGDEGERKKNEKEKGRKKRSWRERKRKKRENIFLMREEREV